MSLNRGLLVVAGCLGLAVGAQWALQEHLRPADSPYPPLRARLSDVPLTLNPDAADPATAPSSPWVGLENPNREELGRQLTFADEYLFRRYVPKGNGPPVDLYMVYSHKGDDRKHHPEICVGEAAGKPEDVSARAVLFLDAKRQRPVQRYRYQTGTNRGTVLYYWHYTVQSEQAEGETLLQGLHRRTAQSPPSITVQVSTTAPMQDLDAIERSFLPALDAVLQKDLLPPRTEVGCDRVPVTLIRQ